MTLDWELKSLRKMIQMRLGDPTERLRYQGIIDRIEARFQEIENALR